MQRKKKDKKTTTTTMRHTHTQREIGERPKKTRKHTHTKYCTNQSEQC